jgi:thioredoxin-like negative regulator of GroEL
MRVLASLAALAIAFAAPTQAAGISGFQESTFRALQARNLPVVVFVHAPWCPICRAQEHTIKQLLATPNYKEVTVLTIDFDTQKPLWSKFGARQQSTLIGFRGKKETGRLAYDSDPARVTAVLASTVR